MENDKIIFWRNFLLRALLIGILFAILTFVFLLAFWHTWESWIANFFGTNEKDLGIVLLNFFMNVRLVLLFLFLSPAIALHSMRKKVK